MPYETYSKRQKRISKAGQADVYQYDVFSKVFRNQVGFIWKAALGDEWSSEYWGSIHDTLAEELGLEELASYQANDAERCLDFIQGCDNDAVLDIIELSFSTIDSSLRSHQRQSRSDHPSGITRSPDQAISDLNYRFQEHAIGFEFVEGRLIRKDSQYLHKEAVKPALGLLNEPGFSGPQDEFLRAHEHLRAGEYQDAIVDANNAFESTMKAICDLRGWTYPATAPASKLIAILFDKELMPTSLISQFEHLKGVLEAGLPTVRNKMGAHGSGSAPAIIPEYMAGYALHLAAANIVLLTQAHKVKP